jgi:hypothetical protein
VQFPSERDGTCCAEYVFLHPVGSACHVMHSGLSGPQNVNPLFFVLRWHRETL